MLTYADVCGRMLTGGGVRLLLLADGGSASASEIVAGSIQVVKSMSAACKCMYIYIY
jgi:hypothetical protein